jgi:hypothetical protein
MCTFKRIGSKTSFIQIYWFIRESVKIRKLGRTRRFITEGYLKDSNILESLSLRNLEQGKSFFDG